MDAPDRLSELRRIADELREWVEEENSSTSKKSRTLEDALQEALDNSTPQQPGYPNSAHREEEEEEYPIVWL